MEKLRGEMMPPLTITGYKREDPNLVAVPKTVAGEHSFRVQTVIKKGSGGELYYEDRFIFYKTNGIFEIICLHDSDAGRLEEKAKELETTGFQKPERKEILTPDGKGRQVVSHVLFAIKHKVKVPILGQTVTT